MNFSIQQISDMIGADHRGLSDRMIDTLLTDSRSLSRPDSTLFFAIRTSTDDGHNYIRKLYDMGVRAFVTDHTAGLPDMPDADLIVVPSGALHALQNLAGTIRRNLSQDTTVIAITGSRGKTTLKEWLATLLSPDRSVSRSPRSYNSQTGVPLSIWQADPMAEALIIEAGISRPGEMSRLTDVIRPDIAVLTNIHDDHTATLGSADEKCAEKSLLLSDARVAVYCADDMNIASRIHTLLPGDHRFGWSLAGNNEARLQFSHSVDPDGNVMLTVRDLSGNSAQTTPVRFSQTDVENACHAAAVMAAMNYDAPAIAARISSLRPVSTRTDVSEGLDGMLVIRDRYEADDSSLGPALDFMRRRVTDDSLTTVVTSVPVLQDPVKRHNMIRTMADELSVRHIDSLIVTAQLSDEERDILTGAVGSLTVFESAEDLLAALPVTRPLLSRRVLLITGADPALDAVAAALQARRHETMLEVNLDALVDNYNFYRRRLTDSHTGIVCMIKASGYGAGSYEPARTLQAQGAAYLAVAVLDEGIELRRAGITMPIMVLNPRVVNYDEMFAHRLEPEIFSFDELDAIIAHARRRGIRNYPVHIKLDTGMHRLGFIGDELPELIAKLHSQDEVEPVTVFSHLAAADEPALDDYTMEQLDKFDRWAGRLREEWPGIRRHILNSTGITRFPERQYELVRLGICLYGVATMNDGSQDGLRPVSSLSTSVIALRDWPAGTTIGYGCAGQCMTPSRIATIPIGYADGINRHLGNGVMKVSINGHRCPTIGRICMDICMIDVTECGDDVHVGDRVEIFGPAIPVTELSEQLETIPYEILTSVSTRVKRVYYRE